MRRTFRRPLATAAALIALCAALGAHAAPAASAEAYVSNQNGDISVIDLATMQVTRTIDAYGEGPRGIGVTADGKLLVVANREGGSIALIDRKTGKLVRQVPIGANPEFVRTRGKLAFVSFEPSSTGGPPPKPGEKAEPPKGKEAGGDDKDEVARIAIVDLEAGKMLRSIEGGLETEGIEFSADGQHILVTNEEADTVTVHHIASGKLVQTIDTKPYGDRPRGIKMAPDGKSYVATLEHGDAFVVIDSGYKVVKSVKTAEYPYGIAFDRTGERLFVAAARSKVLQVFDAKTYALLKAVPTGTRCWHFSFTPDDKTILVGCGRSDEVVAIDAKSLEVVKRIPDKKLPWGIVTYPKSVGSLDWPE